MQNQGMHSAEDRQRFRFIRRIESLARNVGHGRFMRQGIDAFLRDQESIFALQCDVQRAISDYKLRARVDRQLMPHLEELRKIRWLSRRLGDAVAWSVLLHNRKVIFALAENDRVPIPTTESDGTRGVFGMARTLTGPGKGLPIVHDITDVLRVGDITFMWPQDGDPTQAAFRTFELKTTRKSAILGEDGTAEVNLEVTLVSNEWFNDSTGYSFDNNAQVSPTLDNPQPVQERREDRRLKKQLQRMDRAKAHRDLPFHSITELGDSHHIAVSVRDEQAPHWAELRRAIRRARVDGYSFFSLDEFVGYAIFYDPNGVTEENVKNSSLPDDIMNSIFTDSGDVRASQTISAMPSKEDDRFGHLVLPFYLWQVPQRAISEILRGKLMISATYNTGRIEQLFRAEGIEVKLERPLAGKDARTFTYVVRADFPGQGCVEYHSGAPWRDMFTAVHEFRGATSVVQRALAIKNLSSELKFEEFEKVERREPHF